MWAQEEKERIEMAKEGKRQILQISHGSDIDVYQAMIGKMCWFPPKDAHFQVSFEDSI